MQGFTLVSANNLTDSTGTPVNNAMIVFQPVDNMGRPLSFLIGSFPSMLADGSAVSAPVVNGSFSIQLADTSLTTPTHVAYCVSLVGNLLNERIPLYGYQFFQPTGSAVALDETPPNLPGQVLYQAGPAGPPGPVGSTSGTGLSAITFIDAADGTTRTMQLVYGQVQITP